MSISILDGLNKEQANAVLQTEGPVLIFAGAGSGKTKTLTHRLAYLILEKKVSPFRILAVTFTNKAAQEMIKRIENLLIISNSKIQISNIKQNSNSKYQNNKLPWAGTFHSICAKILRREVDQSLLKYTNNFSIYDSDDQKQLIKRIVKDLKYDPKKFNPGLVSALISSAKSELIDSAGYKKIANDYFTRIISEIYTLYEKRLVENNAMDFDDLLINVVKLFKTTQEILDRYQNQFQYIMVDEYQDTNEPQYQLIKLLSQKTKNICVVGDDFQCFHPLTKLITQKGLKNICNITLKDNIRVASGNGSSVFKGIEKIKKYSYKGKLIRVKTKKNKILLLTPNHIVFSRLGINSNIFYVYLMFRKDKGFRVGIAKGTRITKHKPQNGLLVRGNQEKADKMWILRVCDGSAEAIYWESFFAFKYGIPTVIFFTAGRSTIMDQKQIDDLYKNIDTVEKAKILMADQYLFEEYSHWTPQATIRNSTKRINIRLALFDDRRKSILNPWGMSRLSINSSDIELKSHIEKLGIMTRKGKSSDWRTEITRLDYGEIEIILNKIVSSIRGGFNIVKTACLVEGKRMHFTPASHLRKSMKIAIIENNNIVEDEIVDIKMIDYQGFVYDLEIDKLHNYVANGVVVHNSIYSWRGANFRNILNFERDYPNAKTFKLEQNYRSTENILTGAQALIKNNRVRSEKKLWTEIKSNLPVTVLEVEDENEEIDFIIREIKALQQKLNEIVILYRTNAQSRSLEEGLIKANILYRLIGGIRFYERKEVKDIIAYLRYLVNPNDSVSMERIINTPTRGIGRKTYESFSNAKFKMQNSKSQFKIQNEKIPIKVQDFLKMIDGMREKIEFKTPAEIIDLIMYKTGYKKWLDDGTIENESRLENILELKTVASQYQTIDGFLEKVALVQDTDKINSDDQAVTLMTLHSAKGLEFETVFVVGLEEGLLPHGRSLQDESELEEERRLCYVGMTRAKNRLYLIYSRNRFIFGSFQYQSRSRFIDEISHLDGEAVEFIV
ncbi:MAG: ATP-dependent DNA helicase PcrA [Berkelbacteria bacterium GW2011_GWA2_35_9]|uniref:DNA 3'-5' helicase n=1 Tax=Berkelbacteria bacterium GW2011_GWA2_35_9 TaxID=1618333 RepID=A0A0G0DJJ6_9BACT|nr:MAG: ATP-dependent DNA helicase PcrA [Berkelbacteria bacterium GW2011_GWA2_35_9]